MAMEIPPKNFSISMSIEEILFQMDRSDGNTEKIHAGPCFLNYKLHQELIAEQCKAQHEMLKEQRDFQTKYLIHSKQLVFGTWALVIATLLLVAADLVMKKVL
jgi:hypothetical protein